MKRFFSVLVLMLFFSNSFAKSKITADIHNLPTLETILNEFKFSNQFEKLKNTFNLANENFDFTNADKQILENGKVFAFRVNVINNSKTNFLTIIKSENKSEFSIVYEKNSLNQANTEGYFEHYNENGEFYADFKVVKKGDLYSFKINDVATSKRLNILTAKVGTSCFTKNYQLLKKACESDEVCDTLCDFVSSCHMQMAIVAAAHCAVN